MMTPASQPQRIGVLLNPQSGRVRGNLPRFERLLHQLPAASVTHASNPDEIDQAIRHWALTEDDLLLVVGGDGTLQAALTCLLRHSHKDMPQVMAIPAGTTNMTAKALGLRSSPFSSIKRLSRWLNLDGPSLFLRPTAALQVCDSTSGCAQSGMFFGAGSIVTGVRYFHERVRPKGPKGALGPLTAFVRMLFALFSRNTQHLLPTVDAAIRVHGTTREAPWLVVIATTLDKLLLGSTPFWGIEQAPLHLTAISQPPARLSLALPAVLRGRATPAMRADPGYLSHNLYTAGIEHLSEYLLDGEIFKASGTLELKASAPVRFITP